MDRELRPGDEWPLGSPWHWRTARSLCRCTRRGTSAASTAGVSGPHSPAGYRNAAFRREQLVRRPSSRRGWVRRATEIGSLRPPVADPVHGRPITAASTSRTVIYRVMTSRPLAGRVRRKPCTNSASRILDVAAEECRASRGRSPTTTRCATRSVRPAGRCCPGTGGGSPGARAAARRRRHARRALFPLAFVRQLSGRHKCRARCPWIAATPAHLPILLPRIPLIGHSVSTGWGRVSTSH